MKKLINQFLDVLYPKKSFCCICGFEAENIVCDRCLGAVKHINGRACFRCGKALSDSYIKSYCPDCCHTEHSFDSAFSCFEYDGMGKEIIHRLKYEGKAAVADILAGFMYERLRLEDLEADAIIPVPIHENKLLKRGYNQSLLVAKKLSRYMRLPMLDCIVKSKDTKDQSSLDRNHRIMNVIDAFSFNLLYNISNCKSVLLVDDVYTTGSTVDECSRVLKLQGVQAVYVITAATGYNT
ncbi:MAG: ComF family protein [Bacillota bacterium]